MTHTRLHKRHHQFCSTPVQKIIKWQGYQSKAMEEGSSIRRKVVKRAVVAVRNVSACCFVLFGYLWWWAKKKKTKWFIFCRSNMCLVCLVWFMWCKRGLRWDKWVKTKAIGLFCLQNKRGKNYRCPKGTHNLPTLRLRIHDRCRYFSLSLKMEIGVAASFLRSFLFRYKRPRGKKVSTGIEGTHANWRQYELNLHRVLFSLLLPCNIVLRFLLHQRKNLASVGSSQPEALLASCFQVHMLVEGWSSNLLWKFRAAHTRMRISNIEKG